MAATGAPIRVASNGSSEVGPSTQMPRLPQEMLDAIVDASHADRSRLKALALTARCFTDRAQRHLHHTIQVQSRQDAVNLLELCGTSEPSSRLKAHVRELIVGQRELFVNNRRKYTRDEYHHAVLEARQKMSFDCTEDVHRLIHCFPWMEALDLQCYIRMSRGSAHASLSPHTESRLRLRALRLRTVFLPAHTTTALEAFEAENAFFNSILHAIDLTNVSVLSLCIYQTTSANALLELCSSRLQHLILRYKLPRGEIVGPLSAPDLRHNTTLNTIHVDLCGCNRLRTINMQLATLTHALTTLPAAAAITLREVHVTILSESIWFEQNAPEASLRALVMNLPRRAGIGAGSPVGGGKLELVLYWHLDAYVQSHWRRGESLHPWKERWEEFVGRIRATCDRTRPDGDVSLSCMPLEYRYGVGPPQDTDVFRVLAGLPEHVVEPWQGYNGISIL